MIPPHERPHPPEIPPGSIREQIETATLLALVEELIEGVPPQFRAGRLRAFKERVKAVQLEHVSPYVDDTVGHCIEDFLEGKTT